MKKYLTFQQIRLEFLRCRLKNANDYYEELPKHPNWPPDPQNYYEDKWPGWKTFLFSDHNHAFLALFDLTVDAKKHGVLTMADYLRLCRSHYSWPFNPEKVYEDWPGEKKFLEMVQEAELPFVSPLLEKVPPEFFLRERNSATA